MLSPIITLGLSKRYLSLAPSLHAFPSSVIAPYIASHVSITSRVQASSGLYASMSLLSPHHGIRIVSTCTHKKKGLTHLLTHGRKVQVNRVSFAER